MKYQVFENYEAFLQHIFDFVDTQRTILMFNDHDLKFKDPKSKTINKLLTKNLQFVMPQFADQDGSQVAMSFSRFDIKYLGNINDFWFIGMNVYSNLCAPVFMVVYIGEHNNLSYFIPMMGNTYNPISQKPFGADQETDEAACQSLLGISLGEFSKNPEKRMCEAKMLEEVREHFDLPSYSILNKVDAKTDCSNLYEFTETKKPVLL